MTHISHLDRRGRGSVLFDAIMAMLVIFGLIAGVMVMNSTAGATREARDWERKIATISNEVFTRTARLANLCQLPAAPAYAGRPASTARGTCGDKTSTVMSTSSLPDHSFDGISISVQGHTLIIEKTGLTPEACQQLGNGDEGRELPFPNYNLAFCNDGDLVVNLQRNSTPRAP